jgi:hypothetical protein
MTLAIFLDCVCSAEHAFIKSYLFVRRCVRTCQATRNKDVDHAMGRGNLIKGGDRNYAHQLSEMTEFTLP